MTPEQAQSVLDHLAVVESWERGLFMGLCAVCFLLTALVSRSLLR